MFPYLTPTQIRLENEQRQKDAAFPPMHEGVRAELEARQFEEAETLLAQSERPARRFNIRSLWPRPALWKLQRNLK